MRSILLPAQQEDLPGIFLPTTGFPRLAKKKHSVQEKFSNGIMSYTNVRRTSSQFFTEPLS